MLYVISKKLNWGEGLKLVYHDLKELLKQGFLFITIIL